MLDDNDIQVILKIAYANVKNAKDEVHFFNKIFENQKVLNSSNKALFLKMLNQFQPQAVDEIFQNKKYTQFMENSIDWKDLFEEDLNEKLFHQLVNYTKKPTKKEDVALCFETFSKKGKSTYLHLALEMGYKPEEKEWKSKTLLNKLIGNVTANKKPIHWAMLYTLMQQDRSINPFKYHPYIALDCLNYGASNFFADKNPISEKYTINKNEVLVNDKIFLDIIDMLKEDNIKTPLTEKVMEYQIGNWLKFNDKQQIKLVPLLYELIDDSSQEMIKAFIEKKQKYKKYEKLFNVLSKYIEKKHLENMLTIEETHEKPKKTMKI
jgi:hypothetical protein